jgi:hypothetical protein
VKTSIAVAVLFALFAMTAGTVYPQPSPSAPATSPSVLRTPQADRVEPEFFPPSPSRPLERTVDQMLDELVKLQAMKAELEKKEQELVKEVRKMVNKQHERMKQLNLLELPPAGDGPPPIPLPIPTPLNK